MREGPRGIADKTLQSLIQGFSARAFPAIKKTGFPAIKLAARLSRNTNRAGKACFGGRKSMYYEILKNDKTYDSMRRENRTGIKWLIVTDKPGE